MTTIAYRDGVMAADSCEIWGGLKIAGSQKLYRVGEAVIGVAGDSAAGNEFIAWYRAGMPKRKRPALKKGIEFYALVATPEGLAFWDELAQDRINAPFFAIGTGLKYAMGAMGAGATAITAVEVACGLDRNSDFPVVSMKVE
jgi:ATP-dependent protease HslVU (ClpYQ) peptidase subunit